MVRVKPGMTFGGNYAGKYIFSFRKLAFSDGLCTEVLNMQNFQNRAEDKHNAVIRPVLNFIGYCGMLRAITSS